MENKRRPTRPTINTASNTNTNNSKPTAVVNKSDEMVWLAYHTINEAATDTGAIQKNRVYFETLSPVGVV